MYENRTRVRVYDSPKLIYGFFVATGFAAWLIGLAIATLFLTGCKGTGSPTLPEPPRQYEQLPVTHQIGNISVTLVTEPNPPRGAIVVYPNSVSIPFRFQKPKEEGCGADFEWSQDGVNPIAPAQSTLLEEGQSVIDFTVTTYTPVYKYLMVTIEKSGQPQGTTSFFLDYR